jgi:hypothetical protein
MTAPAEQSAILRQAQDEVGVFAGRSFRRSVFSLDGVPGKAAML